jgi:hypothetical protein
LFVGDGPCKKGEVNFAQFVVSASDLSGKDMKITSVPNSSAGVFADADQFFESAVADPGDDPAFFDFLSFVKIRMEEMRSSS